MKQCTKFRQLGPRIAYEVNPFKSHRTNKLDIVSNPFVEHVPENPGLGDMGDILVCLYLQCPQSLNIQTNDDSQLLSLYHRPHKKKTIHHRYTQWDTSSGGLCENCYPSTHRLRRASPNKADVSEVQLRSIGKWRSHARWAGQSYSPAMK